MASFGEFEFDTETYEYKLINEEKAKELGIELIRREILLGEILKLYENPIAISGTHGKTTTSSMISEIFLEAKKNPTISVGGILPSIGGKDSMSGTFMDLTVPPTLTSFALDVMKADNALSPEFKCSGNKVYCVPAPKDDKAMPDFDRLKSTYAKVSGFIAAKKVFAASSITMGGMAAAITKMCLGNGIGFKFTADIASDKLFRAL